MIHPFSELLPEYVKLLSTMVVTRPAAVDQVARKLTGALYLPRYQAVQDVTGVPAVWIACADERESNANPRRALGQGDPWGEVSTHVPRGYGPFKSWADAAVFYLHMHHLDDATQQWSWPYACWKWEAWNGFGPRNHGIHTGYLWAGTSHYAKGKYVADGVWDSEHVDEQLGCVPVALRMAELIKDLAIPGLPARVPGPGVDPKPAPVGVGGAVGAHDTAWLQAALNKVIGAELRVDGLYGHNTRTAVWTYQRRKALTADGLFGPQTDAALTQDAESVSKAV